MNNRMDRLTNENESNTFDSTCFLLSAFEDTSVQLFYSKVYY